MNRTNKRFNGNEPNRRWNFLQVIYSPSVFTVLHGDSLPNVFRPGKSRCEFFQPFRPLCQDLEDMPMGLNHDIKGLTDEVVWNSFMKKVAHTIHENFSWLFPSERKQKLIWVKSHFKSIAVTWIPHCA
jgi:hypothetical protein